MQEIEYKFLVNPEEWSKVDKGEPELILQGFIFKTEECIVRIRIKGSKAYLTIKGKTIGITRSEFEYEIPVSDAETMLKQFTSKQIIKHRYTLKIGDHVWEVDEFHGKLEGLIMAELEVQSEDEKFELPQWVTENVSTNPAYYNSVLIEKS